MKPYLKTVYREIKAEIDAETGEMLDIVEEKRKILVQGKEQFFTVYSHILGALHELPGNDMKLVTFIMFGKANDDGEFTNTESFREKAAEKLGVSVGTIIRSLKSLTKAGLIIKTASRGVYQINPTYFWKGEYTMRKQRLKLLLEIEAK